MSVTIHSQLVPPATIAKLLSVTERTLRDWRDAGLITAYKVGTKSVRYDLDQVVSAMVTPVAQPKAMHDATRPRVRPRKPQSEVVTP